MKNNMQTFGSLKRNVLTWFVLGGILLGENAVHAQSFSIAATNYFGGAGDQQALALSIAGGSLYLSGETTANGGDGILACYALPLASPGTPTWSVVWPGQSGPDSFYGVAASAEGVYVAGYSYARIIDNNGDKETKGITVKFPLTGATGGGYGGAIWDRQTPAAPGVSGYGGGEMLFASMVVIENGTNFVYVTGNGQFTWSNGGRFFVSKLDANGNILWTRDDSASMINNAYSSGRALLALNGNIYVAGLNRDSGEKACLRKYSPSGTLAWSRTTTSGNYYGIAVLGSSIFTVGQVGWDASANGLVDKWDEAGNRTWTQQYDRNASEDVINGVLGLGNHIYAVGSTRGTTAGGADATVLEIDPENGSLLATTLYGGAQDDIAKGIATDGNDLYVVGATKSFMVGGNGTGQNDAFVLRLTQGPLLNIAFSGNQAILFWPTSATNFVLQSTTNLSSPNWLTASNTVSVIAVVVTNTVPTSFFRLQQQ
jgi:hypothetical protein